MNFASLSKRKCRNLFTLFETVQSITVSQSGPVQGGEGEGKGWRGINQVSSVSIQFGDFSC